jgi:putative spermidine/putrescine transport system substrate-binding protein
MSRQLAARAVIAGMFAVLAACNDYRGQRDLTVVGWGGSSQEAHRNAYWTSFTQQTGIKLREDVWNGGIGVLRTKVLGSNVEWDVVQVEVEELILGCEEGLFERLDWNALGGRDAYIAPSVNDCGVGAMVWSELFAYDGNRIKDGPRNWQDFWDVHKFPGRRGLRKTPKYTLEAALMADGVALADVYKVLATPAGVDRAFHKLDELKPAIVWWSTVAQVPDLLASGEVAMSMATPGRLILDNKANGSNFKVVWNENIYAVDSWVILKGSPRAKKAMRLIQYMKRPENEARLPLFIPTGLSNKQAIAALDAPLRQDTPSNPDNMQHALQLDAHFWVENSDVLSQRFDAWAAKRGAARDEPAHSRIDRSDNAACAGAPPELPRTDRGTAGARLPGTRTARCLAKNGCSDSPLECRTAPGRASRDGTQ